MTDFDARYALYRHEVEAALAALPMTGAPDSLKTAMRYSLLGGGKRLRGCLALAATELNGGDIGDALPFACAIEMIHAYSLIHDDLPAMDNDDMRRGKPSCHIAFGEAMAILAGDGLLNYAFETMAASGHPRALNALGEVARAAGIGGMIAGQVMDLQSEGQTPDMDTVLAMYRGKTAALIAAPMVAGLILSGADDEKIAAGRAYGEKFGMVFQMTDDLLDALGDEKTLGKHTGKDAAAGKMTYIACRGVDGARQDAEKYVREACAALDSQFIHTEFLKTLAKHTLSRVQ